MSTNDYILIKPHHLLDIIKLYGFGLNSFVPDTKYNHDFYKIGNLVLNNLNLKIKLTLANDDICIPCVFNKKNKCSDKIDNFIYSSKDEWNKIIDTRLVNVLKLNLNEIYLIKNICEIAIKILTPKIIKQVWNERPTEETSKRTKYLLIGLKKYLNP